jgi:hypothetical protein
MRGYPAVEKKNRSIAFRTRVVHFKVELPGQLSSWKRGKRMDVFFSNRARMASSIPVF